MRLLTNRSHSFNIAIPDTIKAGVAYNWATAARIAYTCYGVSVDRSPVPVTRRVRRTVALPA